MLSAVLQNSLNQRVVIVVLALICMALALVVAKYSRQQASVELPSAIASGVEEGK